MILKENIIIIDDIDKMLDIDEKFNLVVKYSYSIERLKNVNYTRKDTITIKQEKWKRCKMVMQMVTSILVTKIIKI
jgi:hypothetical protein